jgi:hypothetical protein
VWDGVTAEEAPSITITLYQDGSAYTAVEPVTLTNADGNDYKYTFTDLPQYAQNGHEYQYSVQEAPLTGYTQGLMTQTDGVWTVTNTYTPGTTSRAVAADDQARDQARAARAGRRPADPRPHPPPPA